MTQEEKELLIRDLCARLLYRPKGVRLSMVFDPKDIAIVGYSGRFVETVDEEIEVERVRLYLRPMSSMTEAEEIYYNTIYTTLKFYEKEDWLNAHHFDYRIDPSTGKTLIESGIAIEAPEGMYKND